MISVYKSLKKVGYSGKVKYSSYFRDMFKVWVGRAHAERRRGPADAVSSF